MHGTVLYRCSDADDDESEYDDDERENDDAENDDAENDWYVKSQSTAALQLASSGGAELFCPPWAEDGDVHGAIGQFCSSQYSSACCAASMAVCGLFC